MRLKHTLGVSLKQRRAVLQAAVGFARQRRAVEIELADLAQPPFQLLEIDVVLFQLGVGEVLGSRFLRDLGFEIGAPIDELLTSFPHPNIRKGQEEVLAEAARTDNPFTYEGPTGTGKSAINMAILRALSARRKPGLFYVTPTKAQLEQLRSMFPELIQVMGRSEYECLYYTDRENPNITAAQSPCYMLDCPHRVDPMTGQVEEEGAEPCPYFAAKHQALKAAERGTIVVCTTAFFVLNRLLLQEWRNLETNMVILDEVHRLAATMRNLYEHTITDFHL